MVIPSIYSLFNYDLPYLPILAIQLLEGYYPQLFAILRPRLANNCLSFNHHGSGQRSSTSTPLSTLQP